MWNPAAFWDAQAPSYAKQPVENPEALGRKIAMTVERMAPDSVVLDIGCGTGSLALRLAPHAGHVHGLDISPEMMRIAREKAHAQSVDNVTFHTGPVEPGLEVLKPGTFDGVCAHSILHLLDDRAAALRFIFDLLKPGGFFVSSTVCLGESWFPFRPVLWAMRKTGKAPRVSIFSIEALKAEMEDAGFVQVGAHDVGAKATTGFIVAQKPRLDAVTHAGQ